MLRPRLLRLLCLRELDRQRHDSLPGRLSNSRSAFLWPPMHYGCCSKQSSECWQSLIAHIQLRALVLPAIDLCAPNLELELAASNLELAASNLELAASNLELAPPDRPSQSGWQLSWLTLCPKPYQRR